MKVAIIMTGHFRTLPLCWPGMLAMFEGHDLDITVVSSEPDKTQAFWDIVKPNRLLLIPEPDPESLPKKEGWVSPHHISAIAQMVKAYEAAKVMSDVGCDVMCRLRPDLEITTPLETDFDRFTDDIHLPKFNNWGGLNNQFLIGHPSYVRTYLQRKAFLPDYLGRPGDEPFQKWLFDRCQIPISRTGIKFNLLREDRRRIAPRYNTGEDVGNGNG